MAKTIIDELVTLITLDSDTKSQGVFNAFKNGLTSIRRAALLMSGATVAVGTAFGLLTNKTAEGVEQQGRFAQSIGVSFERLQELQFAVKSVGGSAEDIDEGLQHLTETMSSPIPGEFNRELALLGIQLKNARGQALPATTVFLEIAQAFRNLNTAQQVQLGEKLGFSPALIRLLQSGLPSILASMREAKQIGGVIPQKAVQDSITFTNSLLALKTSLSGIIRIVVLQFIPVLTQVINKIENLIVTNRKLISQNLKLFFQGMGEGLKDVQNVLNVFFNAIADVISHISLLKQGFDGLSKAEMIGKAIAIAFGVITGAIVVANIEIVAVVAAITALIAVFPKLKHIAIVVFGVIRNIFSQLKQGIESVVAAIEKPFKIAFRDFERLKNLFHSSTQPGAIKTTRVNPLPFLAKLNPALSRMNQANNVTINVNGSGQPQSVAKEVHRQFNLSTAAQIASPGFNRPPVA